MDETKDPTEPSESAESTDIVEEAVDFLKMLKTGADPELVARVLTIRHDLKHLTREFGNAGMHGTRSKENKGSS